MTARVVYTCNTCRREYLDAHAPGTARLSVRSYDGVFTDLDWCSPECFERGIIAASQRMQRRRTVAVEAVTVVESPAPSNVRQLPRKL